MVICVEFLPDVACQKLVQSAHVARNYSKNKSGTFYGPRYMFNANRHSMVIETN